MKIEDSISDWYIQGLTGGVYVLVGRVGRFKGHESGIQTTSTLIRIDFEKHEAETLNTIYKLA